MTDDEQAVVLVPVLARPARAQPLVDSLRATSQCRLIFIANRDDHEQIEASRATGCETIVVPWGADHADFAKKVNHAFALTDEPWIFCGADDLRFRDGWLHEAIKVGDRSGVGVVGTQDLGNPQVKRGKHSTHPLVRRAYIDEQGGTFDNTGAIYSEAYDHQWVDTELVTIAKARGQWQFAQRSVVEHFHPHWGKAEMDPTYEKAIRAGDGDRTLYVSRMRRFNTLEARARRRG